VIVITPEQQERLGKLLSMGIPLPIAFPLAMDPTGSVRAIEQTNMDVNRVLDRVGAPDIPKVVKRKASAYSRKYKTEFKKVASTYKNKNGTWKKGGFRKAVKAAHKAVKK
jgi:hypothetical protein